MVRETGVQSQVESYQRPKKCNLIPPCLTLSIIRYASRVKWSNLGNLVVHFPTPWCSSYWKGSLLVPLDKRKTTLLIYFLINALDSCSDTQFNPALFQAFRIVPRVHDNNPLILSFLTRFKCMFIFPFSFISNLRNTEWQNLLNNKLTFFVFSINFQSGFFFPWSRNIRFISEKFMEFIY